MRVTPHSVLPDGLGCRGHFTPTSLSAIACPNHPHSAKIGSIRRECLDHVVVFSERHLRHLLLSYMKYYNGARTHLSLAKDAPISRAVDRAGHILCRPTLGRLHHQYARI